MTHTTRAKTLFNKETKGRSSKKLSFFRLLFSFKPHQPTGASFLFEFSTFFVLCECAPFFFFYCQKSYTHSSVVAVVTLMRGAFFFKPFVWRARQLRARSKDSGRNWPLLVRRAVALPRLSYYTRTLLTFIEFLCMCVPVSQSAEWTFEY